MKLSQYKLTSPVSIISRRGKMFKTSGDFRAIYKHLKFSNIFSLRADKIGLADRKCLKIVHVISCTRYRQLLFFTRVQRAIVNGIG